jgi:signal transduction histidine kinase
MGEGPREVLITTSKTESGEVAVAVCDTGPGLAPAALEHLFEAFHTTKPNGLGLGLSICRSIIEGHGGRLWASANSPRGAVLQFTLPGHARVTSKEARGQPQRTDWSSLGVHSGPQISRSVHTAKTRRGGS